MRARYGDQEPVEGADDEALWEFCKHNNVNPWAGTIGICCGVLVVIINTIVKMLNVKMASFSRFKSLSQQQTAISNYHFFFIVINTILIPFSVSIRFQMDDHNNSNVIPTHIMSPLMNLLPTTLY
jgi:hypothetical protein